MWGTPYAPPQQSMQRQGVRPHDNRQPLLQSYPHPGQPHQMPPASAASAPRLQQIPAQWGLETTQGTSATLRPVLPQPSGRLQDTHHRGAAHHEQTQPSTQVATRNIKRISLLFGNPGAGKSTIANGLAKEPAFKAGVACSGVTVKIHSREDGVLIVDTPGLSDPLRRQEAAEECTKALKECAGNSCQVLFLVKQAHGRVSADDRFTINAILQAAPDIDTKYGIIVNECHGDIMKWQRDAYWGECFASVLFRGVLKASEHVFFNPYDDEWQGEDVVPRVSRELAVFMEGLPVATWSSSNEDPVFGMDFEEMFKKLKVDAVDEERLRKAKEDVEKKLRQQAERAQKNFVLAIVASPLALVACTPAFLTTLGIGGWDARVVCAVPLPGGHNVRLLLGLLPYNLAFTAWKALSAFKVWICRPDAPEQDFLVFGQSFFPPWMSGALKNWQVWLLVQCLDAACDAKTFFDLVGASQPWIVTIWFVTLCFSIAVPVCFCTGMLKYSTTLLLEGFFEDDWQSILSVAEIASTQTPTIPMSLIFLSICALLGVVELAGTLKWWLRAGTTIDELLKMPADSATVQSQAFAAPLLQQGP